MAARQPRPSWTSSSSRSRSWLWPLRRGAHRDAHRIRGLPRPPRATSSTTAEGNLHSGNAATVHSRELSGMAWLAAATLHVSFWVAWRPGRVNPVNPGDPFSRPLENDKRAHAEELCQPTGGSADAPVFPMALDTPPTAWAEVMWALRVSRQLVASQRFELLASVRPSWTSSSSRSRSWLCFLR